MLEEKGFNEWAESYDASVAQSDEEGSYPFAGYQKVQQAIYEQVMAGVGHEPGGRVILDLGFGTGHLTKRFYDAGFTVYGQDFSEEMLKKAQAAMPRALLYQGDLRQGLAEPLRKKQYDAVVAAYSIHHLSNEEKPVFLKEVLAYIKEGGQILLGDVAFQSRSDLEACRKEAADRWDEEECYLVADELKEDFPQLHFQSFSSCAGLLSIRKE